MDAVPRRRTLLTCRNILLLTAFLCLLRPPGAGADAWYLDPDGDDDTGAGTIEFPYRTLQHAVDMAAGGDSILLNPGQYTGLGQYDVLVEGMGLSVIGLAGADSTVMELDSLGRGLFFKNAPDDSSYVTGLTFRRGMGDVGGALRVKRAKVLLESCRFQENLADEDGGALYVHPDSEARLVDCRFEGNRSGANGGAIYGSTESAVQLERCALGDNHAEDEGGGLFLSTDAVADLENCLLAGNRADVRIHGQQMIGAPDNMAGYAWVNFVAPPIPWSQVVGVDLHLTGVWLERAGFPGSQLKLNLEEYGCLDFFDTQSEAICHPEYSQENCHNLFASWSGDSLMPLAEPWLWPADSLLTVRGNIFDCDFPGACDCWVEALRVERDWVNEVASFTLDLSLRWHSTGRPRVGGGALALEDGAQATLTHCTLALNESGQNGGALVVAPGATAELANCIVSGNPSLEGSQIALCPGGVANVSTSNIENEDWGPLNLAASPAFLDTGLFPEGFALADSSPCIAAGDPFAGSDEDLAGAVRPNPPPTPPDIGCYESSRGVASAAPGIPARPGLVELAAHPNPFNPRVILKARLTRAGEAELRIYDPSGRRQRVLHRGALPAGRHAFVWDGRDGRGRALASGVDFAEFSSPSGVARTRLVLLR